MPSRRQIKSATMETLFRTIYTCPKGLIPASCRLPPSFLAPPPTQTLLMVARWWWHVADANYVNVFLLTYHSWATSAELLDSMTHLYLELSNQNDQNKVALMRYTSHSRSCTSLD